MQKLNPFVIRCSKCCNEYENNCPYSILSGDVNSYFSLQYLEAESVSIDPDCIQERIKITCKICGYSWQVYPADFNAKGC